MKTALEEGSERQSGSTKSPPQTNLQQYSLQVDVHTSNGAIAEGDGHSTKNVFVHRGTCTDTNETRTQKCKYCLVRLLKLRKLDKALGSLPCHTRRRGSLCESALSRDQSCQTSAALFEQAPMTPREIRCFMLLLRYREGKPLRSETFCTCVHNGKEQDCSCGEDDKHFDWLWESDDMSKGTCLQERGQAVLFHKDYSCGTSAIRSHHLMDKGQYFWEIKMTTPVYGTDMMIGVGTSNVNVNGYTDSFCSMLGCDGDSWGLSYDGRVQHNGIKMDYCGRFGQGAIIGIHLDMWHGTLAFYKNRQSLGVAFRGLRGQLLYPMLSSTAARSAMRVVSSRSFPSSLQFLCCRKLRRLVPPHLNVVDAVAMPPGLRNFLSNKVPWLVQAPPATRQRAAHTQAHICNICLPLKNVFEGYTDEEESSDDDHHVHNVLNFLDSENETDSEDEEMSSAASSCAHGPLESQAYMPMSSPSLSVAQTLWRASFHGAKRKRLDLLPSAARDVGEEEDESESENSCVHTEEPDLSPNSPDQTDQPGLSPNSPDHTRDEASGPCSSGLGKRKRGHR